MKRYSIILFFMYFVLIIFNSQATSENIDSQVKHNVSLGEIDKIFLDKNHNIKKEFEQNKSKLEEQRLNLKQQEHVLSQKMDSLHAEYNNLTLSYNDVSRVMVFNFLKSTLFYVFFPITIINLFMYLYFKDEVFFKRYKIYIYIITSLLLLFFAAPLFAQESTKSEPILENLDQLNKVIELKKDPVEEAIYLLKNSQTLKQTGVNAIELPKFPQWSLKLRPLEGVIFDLPLTIHYSLGVLYLEKGRSSEALNEFKKIGGLNLSSIVSLDNKYGTIGVQLSIKNKIPTVIGLTKKTPATQGGLQVGDQILKVNNTSTKRQPLPDVVKMILGPKGTEVSLTIGRVGFKNPQDFTLRRGTNFVYYLYKKPLEDLLTFLGGAGEDYRKEAPGIALALITLCGAHQNVDDLLLLADLLKTQNFPELAEKAGQQAVKISSDYEELLEICKSFLTFHSSVAKEAIFKAMDRSQSNKQIFEVVEFSLHHGAFPQEVINKASDLFLKHNTSTSDLLEVAGFFFKINQPEKAKYFLATAIKLANRSENLLEIALWCLEKNSLTQAHEAVTKIFELEWGTGLYDPLVIPPLTPDLRKDGRYELVAEKIKLSIFLGILDQALGRLQAAEKHYTVTINRELEGMLKKLGYDISGNLNHFYYLKNLWSQLGRETNLGKLIPIYTFFQEKYLNDQKNNNLKEIERINNELEALEENKQEREREVSKLSYEVRKQQLRLLFWYLHYLSIFTTLCIILWGCTTKAYKHALMVSDFKTFAFLGKFLENIGWVECFSFILILPGGVKIGVGQFMQIFQKQARSIESYNTSVNRIGPPLPNQEVIKEVSQSLSCPNCKRHYDVNFSGKFCEDCGAPLSIADSPGRGN